MQVELSVVLSVASAAGTLVWGVIVWLGKANVKQHEDALDTRFETQQANIESQQAKHNELGARLGGRVDSIEGQLREATERAHREELARTKVEGELSLLRQSDTERRRQLELIEEKMVTRTEWEPRMKSIEEVQRQILIEVRAVARQSPTRYSSSQVPAPTVAPPRPEKR